jgi:predicted RNA-binding protein with PIN domain
LASARRDLADLQARLGPLTEERNRAVRAAKQLEVELAEARRDRRTARAATREAEAELAILRAQQADLLAAAMETGADPGPVRRPRAKGGPARATARTRPLPTLPAGVFDGSSEAQRHLVSSGEALLLVDGYNVARSAWSGITPEEERRRTVRLLEEVRARSGGTVHVVFDGESDLVAPQASRSVRVHFSPSGVTADDEIARILGELPRTMPVVVVSSDRAVVADARRQHAATMSSADFVAAARR